MAARTVMIQGTGSHVGKSVMTAALCRLFARQGVRVAPFKAQNMSNNSFVTPDGKEIGRAQAVQAAACRLPARADFNPVLIKPFSEQRAQMVVNGEVAGELHASDFGRVRRDCAQAVEAAFARLAAEFDLVVLEGAGSPAEVNLRDMDIVNMHMARIAQAPVLLVGDIDRGGVLAALVGTMVLLTPEEQSFVRGFVINKFRGDVSLLTPGIQAVETRTGVPCLGVVPYWRDLALPQEDALEWERLAQRRTSRTDEIVIGVADVPCISNFTDLELLAGEPDVRIVRVAGPVVEPLDLLIFPGAKQTAQALRFVKDCGIDKIAEDVLAGGGTVIGICGGYQMLGRRLRDPERVESSHAVLEGVGLLDVETVFARPKVTRRVTGIHRPSGAMIDGYEIHMGRTVSGSGVEPFLDLCADGGGGRNCEGAVSRDGRVIGTYVHGLFDAPGFRRWLLNRLRARHGWNALDAEPVPSLDQELDRLADLIAMHVDVDRIREIIGPPLAPSCRR
jgi:cobyric acid synthase CobQ